MSLEQWIKDFYDKSLPAIPQSIKKWEGLRHLEAYGVRKDPERPWMITDGVTEFPIDNRTCQLCKDHDECAGCPLFVHLGYQGCDVGDGPYNEWFVNGDPEPMIKALHALDK